MPSVVKLGRTLFLRNGCMLLWNGLEFVSRVLVDAARYE